MKIICIGRNYAAHAKELGNDIPEEPVIFMKPKSAMLKPGLPLYYPAFTNELHYECELVLKVCKNGSFIPQAKARSYYDAISVGFDFTARDVQDECKKKGLPWEKAKAFDNSAAIGEFKKVEPAYFDSNIEFHLDRNGVTVQKGCTSQLLFGFDRLICEISKYFTINIGDLIYTGTPAGVGECMPGDVLKGYIGKELMLAVQVK